MCKKTETMCQKGYRVVIPMVIVLVMVAVMV